MNAPDTFLEAAHRAAQPARFAAEIPSPAMWTGMVAAIKQSKLSRVEVVFMEIDLVCHGTYTPNSDGYSDNGGFEIEQVLHKGEDIQGLLSADYQKRLEDACFFEYERAAKEAAEYTETDR